MDICSWTSWSTCMVLVCNTLKFYPNSQNDCICFWHWGFYLGHLNLYLFHLYLYLTYVSLHLGHLLYFYFQSLCIISVCTEFLVMAVKLPTEAAYLHFRKFTQYQFQLAQSLHKRRGAGISFQHGLSLSMQRPHPVLAIQCSHVYVCVSCPVYLKVLSMWPWRTSPPIKQNWRIPQSFTFTLHNHLAILLEIITSISMTMHNIPS